MIFLGCGAWPPRDDVHVPLRRAERVLLPPLHVVRVFAPLRMLAVSAHGCQRSAYGPLSDDCLTVHDAYLPSPCVVERKLSLAIGLKFCVRTLRARSLLLRERLRLRRSSGEFLRSI